jgi:hypothetical protein
MKFITASTTVRQPAWTRHATWKLSVQLKLNRMEIRLFKNTIKEKGLGLVGGETTGLA